MRAYYTPTGGLEAIDVIEGWRLGFNLGNAVKYICRAGLKEGSTRNEDLEKAIDYIYREVNKCWFDDARSDAYIDVFDRCVKMMKDKPEGMSKEQDDGWMKAISALMDFCEDQALEDIPDE